MKLEVGMSLTYIDENRKERNALVTAIHGDPAGSVFRNSHEEKEYRHWPCVNLAFADINPEAQDQYGRQLGRKSSVTHWQQNSAHGMCWRFVNEEMTGKAAPTVS